MSDTTSPLPSTSGPGGGHGRPTDLPPTPFLAVDAGRLRANIERTQAWADARGVALRPHVKTHKVPPVGRLQVEAGAHGTTVATVGEAEVFADAGFDDIFLAYPLWPDEGKRRRLADLAGRIRLSVGCDSADAAERLAGTGVTVVVEVDSGHHRSGVAPGAAGTLAAACRRLGLDVAGVFTFPGHSYGPTAREAAAQGEDEALTVAAESLRAVGVAPDVMSGGSTPSLAFSGSAANEYRPGVYVMNDAQQWELGSCGPDDVALTCHATVVSHAGGRAVLDSGSKILGADRPPWTTGYGRLLDDAEARLVILSEHHAVATMAAPPPLGSIVRVVPNHACNAINLVDSLVVFEDGSPVARWEVAARGRN